MVEHKLVKQQRERNKQKAQAVKDLRKLKSEEAQLDAEMAQLTGYTSEPIIRYVEAVCLQEVMEAPKLQKQLSQVHNGMRKKYHLKIYQKPSFGLNQMTWVVII